MNGIDLGNITWSQLMIAAAIVAVVDTATGIVGAIAAHDFSLSFLPDFLSSHVLSRVIPIAGAALLGQELNGTPGGQLLFGIAEAGLAAYIIATFPSVGSNLNLGVGLPSITISRKAPAATRTPAKIQADAIAAMTPPADAAK